MRRPCALPPAPYRRGWHFRDGKLICFEPQRITVMRGWPEPLAWRKTRYRAWRHVRPQLSFGLIEEAASGRPLRALARGGIPVPRHWDQPDPGQMLFRFAWTPRERLEQGLRARREAARRFLDTIPAGVRRLVRSFGARQWHMLVLLARVPGAEDLVRSCPGLAWTIASNWVFHKPPVRKPVRAMRRLVRLRRPEAAAWLGFPGTSSTARILARVPPREACVALFCDLRRALHDREALPLLRHLRRVTREAVQLVARPDLRPFVSPSLLHEISHLPRRKRGMPPLPLLRDTIAMAGPLRRRLPAFRSLAQLRRRHDALAAELHGGPAVSRRASLEQLEFPPPPLPGTPDIEPCATPAALLEEGRTMRHCVASRARSVAAGWVFIYRVLRPERATCEIRRDRGRWILGEVRGFRNAAVSAATLRALHAWLGEPPPPERPVFGVAAPGDFAQNALDDIPF